MAAEADGASAGHTGGIQSLIAFVDQYRQELDYDVIRLGLRIRDIGQDWFTWEDLRAVVKGLQRDRTTLLARAVSGDEAIEWTTEAQLLAAVFDRLGWLDYRLQWLGGAAKAEPPEPLERPGVKSKTKQWTGNAVTIEEMDRKLGWRQS